MRISLHKNIDYAYLFPSSNYACLFLYAYVFPSKFFLKVDLVISLLILEKYVVCYFCPISFTFIVIIIIFSNIIVQAKQLYFYD